MTRNHTRSAELAARAAGLTPGGVHSNVRLAGPRVFFERGEGAWLWDVDGNDYVDYLLGQGPNFLGHAPRAVNDAVAAAMRRGSVFGAQHALENDASELFLQAVGWADRVRFGVSGTESVQLALRLARAATGRRRFVRFAGHYHGWLDNVLVRTVDETTTPASAGQLDQFDQFHVLPYNDLAAVETLLAEHADDLAAILLEPVMCNSGVVPPRDGYLRGLRDLCDRHSVVLIFDEVITGFRIAPGGAADRYGVAPDLATYGKAMAGGWPVAAVAGRAELMDPIGTGEVNHSGTFNASVPACAAVAATLRQLRDDPPYDRLETHGGKLVDGLRELGTRHDVPLRAQGLPMAFHMSFGDPSPIHDLGQLDRLDLERYARFAHVLVDYGVWVAPRGIWYISAAHGEKELVAVLERVDAALAAGGGDR
ncbi:aspartate aminotransferase family protein [Actinopolymorpha pittospori]|uniref:Glutamate-1-semialdehyde 2,1-aminomutase n=1 Tax=Actinopolymorpha pittospori TaxID=648752 RepID=A0A927RBB7_9ACTN|nr:aspartate aminotransferase family protein [Actinopolymorpha pittospori]MBE1608599.1 glutamate-1-semialdehyde 2,1-aminomutase [Actinopolymorpha pittospori]